MFEFLTGSPAQTTQLPVVDQQQMGIKNQLANLGLQGISNYNPQKFDFAPIAARARRDFETKTAPSIAERFNAMGNRPSGPVFSALAGAGKEFDENLAALGQHYNMQQQGFDLQRQGQLSNLLGLGLTPNFENIYQPRTTGLFGSAAGGFGQGVGTIAGLYGLGGAGGGLSGLLSLLGLLRGSGNNQNQGNQGTQNVTG